MLQRRGTLQGWGRTILVGSGLLPGVFMLMMVIGLPAASLMRLVDCCSAESEQAFAMQACRPCQRLNNALPPGCVLHTSASQVHT